MIRYIIGRLLWIIPVLFVVSIITFILMHAVPGGPWDREKRAAGGDRRRGSTRKYGLDKPGLRSSTSRWVGDLAPGRPRAVVQVPATARVNDIVADGIWTTVQLGLMAFVAVGRRRHPARDHRRPRPQPLAGLPLHGYLDHRHRHAQLRAGDPADRRLQRHP